MNNLSQPTIPSEQIPPAQKNWFLRHLVISELIGLTIIVLGVTGYYYYQATHPKIDTYVPVHHAPADARADWKTYTNAQYGFEVKYPKESIFSYEYNDDFLVTAPDYPTCTQDISPSCYVFEMSVSDSPDLGYEGITNEVSPMLVDGVSSKKYELFGNTKDSRSNPLAFQIVTPKKNQWYHFYITNFESVALQNQILSTFKFTK